MKKDKSDLNKREVAILNFISKQIKANQYPPSVREICKAVGLNSTATVHGYLEKLEQKGYIRKESQKGRALRVVTGVMSFEEMDAMMYKIEGEDLYLIGTSEHSMIGKFKDQILKKENMPYTMTSYSPCFRKEKGAHGLEERGIYRIHQFEKQEMIVVCEPEDSWNWYNKMWSYTVEFFRSMNIPVRTLECCSGDLADLKAKSCDVEAWSPRQKKYFEVGSCSNLTDAQARRLGIRIKGEKGNYFAHTLNNTVVAPPRMLISIMENNYMPDGSVIVPEVLRPYMGGLEKIEIKSK